jgi:ABC-2 type transport system permease protein
LLPPQQAAANESGSKLPHSISEGGGMNNIKVIFLREYIERVRSKAFIILTVLAPVLMLALTAGPIFLMSKGSKSQKLAVVDLDGRLASLFVERLQDISKPPEDLQEKIKASEGGRQQQNPFVADKYQIERIEVPPGQEAEVRAALSARLKQNTLDAYLWIDKSSLEEDGKVDYYARNVTDLGGVQTIRRAVSAAATRLRLADHGVNADLADKLLKGVAVRTVRVSDEGEKEDAGVGSFVVALFFVMILYVTLILYGITVMRSVIEEKSSRIFEVLLSTVKPVELMAGKILGVAAVGLTQYLIWAVMMAITGGATAAIAMRGPLGNLSLSGPVLIFFVVYFLLGYLLFSSMFAALGAAVNSEQEAQQLQMLVMWMLIVPMITMQLVMRSPSSQTSVILSLIPFFGPILMFLRIVVQMPPAWQIAASIVSILATTALVMWICARIYRVGILMYGKRPTLPEIIRWVRAA